MAEKFSPKDPYEVQAAWDTVITAVEEIRTKQKWSDEYIAKMLMTPNNKTENNNTKSKASILSPMLKFLF